MTCDTSSHTPAHDPTGGVNKAENMQPHEKVSHGPADYATRLTRLQTLGAGEGVPGLLLNDDDGFWLGTDGDNNRWYVSVEWTTRILESCLWETLRGWAKASHGYVQWLPAGINMEVADGEPVRYYHTLLDAADAVIAHLEAK
jgi:hypothetical protein